MGCQACDKLIFPITLGSMGGVSASAAIADNAIVRGDGGSSGVQDSLPTIDDSGNLDLHGGGLQDTNVVTPIKIGDSGNTALVTVNKTVVGAINENSDRIDFFAGAGSFTAVTNPALNSISTSDIDDYIGIVITLTAAGNDQALPSPTGARRFYYVINNDTSTDSIDINGITIEAAQYQKYIWDGTAWVSVSSSIIIWIDDGTDIKSANSSLNLDLQLGVLKDNDVTGGIALGDASNTALAPQFEAASLTGGINESKKKRLYHPAYNATINITADQLSAFHEIDTSGGNVVVTIPDADSTTNQCWLGIIKRTTDAKVVTVQTVSGQEIGGTISQVITEPKKGFQILASGDDSEYEIIQDNRFSAGGSGDLNFFMTDTASDVGGYLAMTDTDLGGGESSVVTGALGVGNDQAVEEWATVSGSPGVTSLQAGIYTLHIVAGKTSGLKTAVLHYKIYKRILAGAETLLMTSQNSPELGSRADLEISASLGADTVILASDRLVVKMLVNVTGAGGDAVITVFMEGATLTRLSVPASSAQLDVRYLIKSSFPSTQTVENDVIFAGNLTSYVSVNAQSANYEIVLADASKIIEYTNGASDYILTIPANSTTAFVIGSWLEVRKTGTGDITVTKAGGVTFRGVLGDVNVNVDGADGFSVFLEKTGTDEWLISGALRAV